MATVSDNVMSRRVRLNVGGRIYETTVATLSIDCDCMLAQLVSSRWNEAAASADSASSDDEIFIDRNGNLFEFVLDFLRNGEFAELPIDYSSLRRLRVEANFYQLPALIAAIDQKLLIHPAKLKLEVGEHSFFSSVETLCNVEPSSKLARRCRQHQNPLASMFVDRDGKNFHFILSFLRSNGDPITLPADVKSLAELRMEAIFYECPRLCELLDQRLFTFVRLHDGYLRFDHVPCGALVTWDPRTALQHWHQLSVIAVDSNADWQRKSIGEGLQGGAGTRHWKDFVLGEMKQMIGTVVSVAADTETYANVVMYKLRVTWRRGLTLIAEMDGVPLESLGIIATNGEMTERGFCA